jgi:TonB family protein
VVDASEEETLVALGEKPADDAPPAEVSAPAAVPARHHHLVGHPPKTTAVAETTDVSSTPKASAPERPEEQPAAAALRPTVDKTESAPPKPAPASAVAIKGAQPAVAARTAGLDPAKTQAAVRSHLGEVQRCYERGKMDYPELKGRVTLKISVSTAGAVTSAAVESSSLGSTFVENCIASAVQGWKFPAPVGGPAIISYPFNLH